MWDTLLLMVFCPAKLVFNYSKHATRPPRALVDTRRPYSKGICSHKFIFLNTKRTPAIQTISLRRNQTKASKNISSNRDTMIAFSLMDSQDLTNQLIVTGPTCDEQKVASSPSSSQTIIHRCQEFGPFDILCGRGRVPKSLVGNRRFHQHIMKCLEEYVNLRSKLDKSNFIRSIADELSNDIGFRFLKKKTESSSATPVTSSDYIELTQQEIYDKVGHTIRDLALKHYGSASIQRVTKSPSSTSYASSKASKMMKKQNAKNRPRPPPQQKQQSLMFVNGNDAPSSSSSSVTSSSASTYTSSYAAMEPQSCSIIPEELSITFTSSDACWNGPILDDFAESYLLAFCDVLCHEGSQDLFEPLPITWNM